MNSIFMDNRQKLLEELIENFTQVARSMHDNHNFPFGKYMLGRQQMMILFFIFEKKGSAPVKEMAKFLRVTPGAVTQFIDALVEKKLVRREENASDRRSINIKLTASSEKQFSDFRKKYFISAGRAFENLNDKELEQFTKLLSKIKKNSD
jgi:DNA-binding MarR family transcriptional regulator